MQNIINKINTNISIIKSIGNSENSTFALFHAVTLDNENMIAFKIITEDVKSGDFGHFDHGTDEENQDLVYLMVFKEVPENIDMDSLFSLILPHNDLVRNTRSTVEKSLLLGENGFDIVVSIDNNTVKLINLNTEDEFNILEEEEAKDFINNAISFTKNCSNRFTNEIAFRSAVFDIIRHDI